MALADNLVTYWKLDGDSIDEEGNNTGTDTSMTYGTSVKVIVEAGIFNGTTSKITIASLTSIPTGSASRSLQAWVRINDTGGGIICMYGTASTAAMFYLAINSTNVLFYGIARDYTPATTNAINTWFHVVLTYNGTTLRLYKNGSELGSGATLALNTATSTDMVLGEQSGGFAGDGPLNGYLDEVVWWDRALSAAEVTELYNSGSGLSYADITGGGTPAFVPKVQWLT